MLNSVVLLLLVLEFHFTPKLFAIALVNFIYQTAKSIADHVVSYEFDK